MEKLTTIIFSIFIALGMTSCTAENQTDETTITTPAAQQTSTGNWLDGERFRSGQDEETVTEWVNSLNLN